MASLTTTQQQYHTMTLASVLAAPLASRGELLGRLFSESSLKELAAVYPVLLEDIFGFGGRPGWNLQLITRKCHPTEFNQVRALLQPSGPLFGVIYRLMAEPHVTYEFPSACMPSSAGGGGGGGGFSALSPGQWSLLSPQSLGGGGGPAWGGSLMLSPFELYLHHFCFFLLNPAQQVAQIAWTAPGDALYPTLLEDLMAYFLPCGAGWVPPLSQPAVHHHPTISMTPEPQRHVTPPRLLLRSSLLRPASPAAGAPPSAAGSHVTLETWRSEALLRAAAAFWLETGPRAADLRSPTPGQNDSFSAKSILYELGTHIPSHDHVRVVRMLVKHMHFFTNYPHHLPGLDEFKRQAQAMLQKKLYSFMRHTFQHWPTDTSFRLVLETWLSYVQPWRYTDYSTRNRSPSQAQPRESDRTVDESWGRFVAENLLFYSTIFRQLLPRFHRMDLTVPKYAYMVFRLSKVLCQPGLSDLVRAAEEMRTDSRWHVSPSESALLYAASVGQHILELEEPGFTYQSMFDASCTQQVHALVRQLSEARATLQARLDSLPPAAAASGSLWASLLSAVGGRSAELSSAEFSPDDTRRGATHLDCAVTQLARLYNVEVPAPGALADSPVTPAGQRLGGWPSATPLGGRPVATPLGGGLLTPSALQSPAARHMARPETEWTPHGPRLTARGRHQLLSGLVRGDVTYQGDPERRPVQSCESAALLRQLQTVAAHLNRTYGATLEVLYLRPDLPGYVARQLLCPPAVYYELVRVADGRSERRAVPRPAALSLRPLADWRCLALLAAAVLAALAAGCSPAGALVLVLVLLPAVLALAAALLQMAADWWRGAPAELTTPQRQPAVGAAGGGR